MKVSYLLGGICCILVGGSLLWYVANQIKRKVPDELGFNAKGIMAGVSFLMIGIYLIANAF